jgi:hypothetical protein
VEFPVITRSFPGLLTSFGDKLFSLICGCRGLSEKCSCLPPAAYPVLTRCQLTKRAIDAIVPVLGTDLFMWDDELPGFGLRTSLSFFNTAMGTGEGGG